MYLISYGCSQTISTPSAFRIAWGVQGVPAIVLFVILFFFPESPRWLGQHERWEECEEVLTMIHGKGNRNDPIVVAELSEIKEAAEIAHESKATDFFALFGPKLWKRTMCGCWVQIWQQLIGGNVMLYYLVYIFNMAGMVSTHKAPPPDEYVLTGVHQSGNTALTSSIIQYVIFLVTTGGILPFVDRLGRRPLLLGGAFFGFILHFASGAVMAVYGHHVESVDGMISPSSFRMAIYLLVKGNSILRWEISGAPAKAVIALAYIFVGMYGLTWAPIGWIYCSEVFPLRYRANGVGLSAASNWL